MKQRWVLFSRGQMTTEHVLVTLLLILGVLAGVVLLSAVWYVVRIGPLDDERLHGTANREILTRATSVQAWRTQGSLKGYTEAELDEFFVKTGAPRMLTTEQRNLLVNLLFDPATYEGPKDPWGRPFVGQKACATSPGIIITFTQNERSLDLFFCFECQILQWSRGNSTKTQSLPRADFDGGAQKLLALMKDIFKDDPQIQAATYSADGETVQFKLPAPAGSSRPLSVSDIMVALHNKMPPARLSIHVAQRGVDFELTDETEGMLKAAGADAQVITSVAEASQRSSATRKTPRSQR